MMLISIDDVEDGIEEARTTANQQALDLVTDKHTKIIQPLREKATLLHTSADSSRTGIRESRGISEKIRPFSRLSRRSNDRMTRPSRSANATMNATSQSYERAGKLPATDLVG